jgi:hypothetical protein
MAVETAAAGQVHGRIPPIGGCLDDLDGLGKRELLFDPADSRSHPFAWDPSLHEDDLPIVPCEHASSCGGLLDRKLDLFPWMDRHVYS